MGGRDTEPGFTLVELLVVLSVITALTAIAVPSYLAQRERAHDTSVKQQLMAAYRAGKAEWVAGGQRYGADLHSNGDFETSADGWARCGNVGTVARSTAWSSSGVASLRVQASASGNSTSGAISMAFVGNGKYGVPVTAGKIYQISAVVNSVTQPRGLRLQLRWFDNSGSQIGSSINGQPGTTQYTTAAGPRRLTMTGTAPSGAAYGAVCIYQNVYAGDTMDMYIDDVTYIEVDDFADALNVSEPELNIVAGDAPAEGEVHVQVVAPQEIRYLARSRSGRRFFLRSRETGPSAGLELAEGW